MYEKNIVSSTPLFLIQWSQQECTSIKEWFQSIRTNTNIWLTLHGVPMKPFSFDFDDDIVDPMGRRSKIRTKNKQDPTTLAKAHKLKFIVGTKKGKDQGEPSSSNVNETRESNLSIEQVEGEHLDEEKIDVDQLEEVQGEGDQEHGEFDEEELPQANKSLPQVPLSSSTLQAPIPTSESKPPVVTCIFPSSAIHVSSTSASEFALDTPHANIEDVFSAFLTLSEVSTTMLDDFDKSMNDSAPGSNESSLENPTNVVIMTSPIVTTTIQDSINPSQDVVSTLR